jgi:LysM repeat protein
VQIADCRILAALLAFALAACRAQATAPALLEITPAATRDIDATATAYARVLAPTPTPAGLYIVQPGDTLGALAEDFGTTVAEIMAANGLTDPDALQVGQPLIIPSLIQSSPALDATPLLSATAALTRTAVIGATSVTSATPTLTATPTLATP